MLKGRVADPDPVEFGCFSREGSGSGFTWRSDPDQFFLLLEAGSGSGSTPPGSTLCLDLSLWYILIVYWLLYRRMNCIMSKLGRIRNLVVLWRWSGFGSRPGFFLKVESGPGFGSRFFMKIGSVSGSSLPRSATLLRVDFYDLRSCLKKEVGKISDRMYIVSCMFRKPFTISSSKYWHEN